MTTNIGEKEVSGIPTHEKGFHEFNVVVFESTILVSLGLLNFPIMIESTRHK